MIEAQRNRSSTARTSEPLILEPALKDPLQPPYPEPAFSIQSVRPRILMGRLASPKTGAILKREARGSRLPGRRPQPLTPPDPVARIWLAPHPVSHNKGDLALGLADNQNHLGAGL